MDILYQFNEKYAPYAGISMTSLFENNRDAGDITVWVLGEGLSEDSVARFGRLEEKYGQKIRYIDAAALVEKIKDMGMPSYRGSYAANIRMFISEIFPEEIKRVIYLDADTIVMSDISDIYKADLKGHTLGMVYDSLGEGHKGEIGLTPDEGYYNSGVILFDVKAWKEKGYTGRIIDHVKTVRAQYPSPDQDLLNVVCRGDIMTLPPSYNFQPFHKAYAVKDYFRNYGHTLYYSKEEIGEAAAGPVIIHFFRFVGEFPWNKDNVHPFNDIFDRYMKESLWNDLVKEDADVGFALKCEKVLYKILPRAIFLDVFRICHRMFYSRSNKMSENNKINKTM